MRLKSFPLFPAFGLLTTILLLVLLSIHTVAAGNVWQEEPPLSQLALQESAMPLGEIIRPMGKGPLSPDDDSHPLNRQNLSPLGLEEWALEYREGYQVALVTNDAQQSPLFIGHYLYRYPDAGHAEKVAAALRDTLQALPGAATAWHERSAAGGSPVRGQSAVFQGKEGTILHWFVGTRGDVLILLVVEGTPVAQPTFDELVSRLLAH